MKIVIAAEDTHELKLKLWLEPYADGVIALRGQLDAGPSLYILKISEGGVRLSQACTKLNLPVDELGRVRVNLE